MFILYLRRHRITEVVLDNPAFGDKNFCLVFSVGYLHGSRLGRLGIGWQQFPFSFSVFGICIHKVSYKSTWTTWHWVASISIFTFGIHYLRCCRTVQVDLNDSAFGGNNFHFHSFSFSVFGICAVEES